MKIYRHITDTSFFSLLNVWLARPPSFPPSLLPSFLPSVCLSVRLSNQQCLCWFSLPAALWFALSILQWVEQERNRRRDFCIDQCVSPHLSQCYLILHHLLTSAPFPFSFFLSASTSFSSLSASFTFTLINSLSVQSCWVVVSYRFVGEQRVSSLCVR